MEIPSSSGRDGIHIPASGLTGLTCHLALALGSVSLAALDGAGRIGDVIGMGIMFGTTTAHTFPTAARFTTAPISTGVEIRVPGVSGGIREAPGDSVNLGDKVAFTPEHLVESDMAARPEASHLAGKAALAEDMVAVLAADMVAADIVKSESRLETT